MSEANREPNMKARRLDCKDLLANLCSENVKGAVTDEAEGRMGSEGSRNPKDCRSKRGLYSSHGKTGEENPVIFLDCPD